MSSVECTVLVLSGLVRDELELAQETTVSNDEPRLPSESVGVQREKVSADNRSAQ